MTICVSDVFLAGYLPVDPSLVTRTEAVRPGMSGHNSLLVGQIGDWTWDAVTAVCGTDVLRARNPAGTPSYLSFYYYRIRGSRKFHLRTPGFGDRLHVGSQVFGFGRESVLTLHRITRSGAGPRGFAPEEFYAFDDESCLYVENYNRWIARGEGTSNRDLVRSAPSDFVHHHLPALPERYSPRPVCHRARTLQTFRSDHPDFDRHRAVGADHRGEYAVDITRDLNAVGLLYFAAYFSIVDWALLQLWRTLGRSDRSFLERVVVDQQLCYLANADADCVIDTLVQRFEVTGDGSQELFDVILRDRADNRVLAISTLRVLGAGAM